MTIEEVSRRARAEGISYGQYVFRHRVERAGKRPEPTEGLTSAVRCPNCEKYFTPNNKTQKFCRAACRSAYNQRHRRKKAK